MEIPEFMRGMVGYLCIDYVAPDGTAHRAPVGTGFFVTVFHDRTKTTASNYLVTAKHVWADHLKDAKVSYIRLNNEHTGTAEYVPLHGGWRFHSDDSVDLAVLPWIPVPGPGAQSGFYTLATDDLVPTQAVLQKLKTRWPPEPGHEVYMIGLLTHHAGHQRNLPIVRVGHLAMVTSELIKGAFGPSSYHLADLQTYPGHSGGPVWVLLGDALYLLGVMVAGFPESQEVIAKQVNGAAVVEQYYALGISLVTPVEKVQEILMSSQVIADRKRTTINNAVDPVPTGVATDAPAFTKSDFETALKKVSRKLSDEEKS